MPYLTPAIPLTSVSAQTLRRLGYTPPRRMRGRYVRTRQGMQWLGVATPQPANKTLPQITSPAPGPPGERLPNTPTVVVSPTTPTPQQGGTSTAAAATAAAASNPNVQSGYCVFTSSPETGGVTSVAQCSAAPGGVPIETGTAQEPYATNAAPTSSAASPVPSTWPTNQPYTDSYGNIWTYSSYYGWQMTGNISGVPTGSEYSGSSYGSVIPPGMSLQNGNLVPTSTLAPRGATPPPAGTPTYPPYYQDPNGDLWYYTTSGWLPRSMAEQEGLQPYTGGSATGYYSGSGTPSTAPPSTWPTTEPYTDSNGNVWTYSAATGWQITSNVYGANALAATGASVVPSNWPTNEPYTDASGNVWTYTGNGWQISQYGTGANPYSSAAAEQTAAVNAQGANTPASANVSVGGAAASPGPYDSIVNWLGEQSLIPGMANGLILLIAGVGVFLLKGKR